MTTPVLRPTLDEVRAFVAEGTYRRVPVTRELYADAFTTIECLRTLRAASNHVFLLESAEADQRWGRYSILGFEPSMEITCLDGHLRVRTQVGTGYSKTTEREVDHPGTYLREVLEEHRAPRIEGLPPFCGGLVGYFAYDYLKYAEPILRRPQGSLGHEDFLDMDLMLFEKLVVFDNYRQKAILIANARLDGSPVETAYEAACAELDRMEELLRHGSHHTFEPLRVTGPLTPRLTKDEFCAMVDAAKYHILEGDIFQVVLSNPISAKAEGSLLDAYRVLRTTNPSPYMFYFTSDDMEFAGASPETLARLKDGTLHTFPLAGTRPRGATADEDDALERELLSDTKELAEHNMLVDLGRNDLGRIAELGSVRVDDYLQVLRFSHVMHLGSTVSAQISPEHDAIDTIDAILPAGTLSGAPKIRACQIICELEGAKRGIYGGAIGYLDLAGNLDTCIGIRLIYKKAGEVCVHTGAGIVADSVGATEYQECLNKARACTDALAKAEGGLA